MHSPSNPRARTVSAIAAASALVLAIAALACLPHAPMPSAALAAETSSSADSSATTAVPLPLQMARVGDAKQLIIATGAKIGDKTGTLRFFDYENGAWVCTLTVPCRFGKNGLMNGKKRWAGNKTTPTGLWKMPKYVFGYAKHAPAGTKERYVRITKRSWWSSRRGSTYNRWVEAKHWPGEYLYGVVPQYEYAVSTGYNERPNESVYGRGSGIFLHIQGNGFTSGCVAIPRASMVRVLKLLDPAKAPAFAVGTLVRGSQTSIWAY
jgi:L,D-peptidoglycan transpeptidase YkuD (ErfK/YbiS/YcfS/YnhG family)